MTALGVVFGNRSIVTFGALTEAIEGASLVMTT